MAATDKDLGGVVRRFGVPPMWGRPPGFATLSRIILEQQVSLASARATYRRLQIGLGKMTAAGVAACSVAALQRHGVTRQKADYLFNLAQLVNNDELDLRGMSRAVDNDVRRVLTAIHGIGPWTADIYLLMALRRPDVWPRGDLALRSAAKRVKRLRTLPTDDRLERIAARWRPWRSVAARILWHEYLSIRRLG